MSSFGKCMKERLGIEAVLEDHIGEALFDLPIGGRVEFIPLPP